MVYKFLTILSTVVLFLVVFTFITIGIFEVQKQNASYAKYQLDLADYKTKCGLAGGIAVKFENTYMCMDPSAVIEIK